MSIATNYYKRTCVAFCLLGVLLSAQACTSNLVLRERTERHLRAKRYTKAELTLVRALHQEPGAHDKKQKYKQPHEPHALDP